MTTVAPQGKVTTVARPVIVGAGLAGLTVALSLAPRPCVVLSAGALGDACASGWAQGGIAAALGADDSPGRHAADTIRAGGGLCEPEVVQRITAAAPGAVAWLERLGARFDRGGHGYALGLEGAHDRHRIVHAGGDGSGAEILRAVVAAVHNTPSITVLEGVRARQLLTQEGRISGVVVEDGTQSRALATSQVVLATGGIGGLWAHTTNPLGAQGQGLALAARAGAVLRDLEMVQFHPTVLDVGRDPMPLVSEAVRGEGALLVDAGGAPLVSDPLAARDVVARALWQHSGQGKQAFLDARGALGADFARHFPGIAGACADAGIDPASDLLPVRPAAHYHCGGVLVDERGGSSVPGLWACGEVASTGLHGANRLASNSLLEAVVCGREVAADLGRVPSAPTMTLAYPSVSDPAATHQIGGGWPTTDEGMLADVRRHLDATLGIVRDPAPLGALVDQWQRVAVEVGADALDDARLTALLVCASALARPESLGGHRWSLEQVTSDDTPAHADVSRHTYARLDRASSVCVVTPTAVEEHIQVATVRASA
ncbi:MAG: L-aspartate oxidase [Ornithinimicrobium sp.]|uniref:L-aspartate oxidase n=1 Tax=Ornithinimicrobium sp. TaxID=1977084 RepID=UPI003D9B754E